MPTDVLTEVPPEASTSRRPPLEPRPGWRDAHRAVRVVGRLRDLPGNLLVRQRAMLEALCRATGARSGWAALLDLGDDGSPRAARALAYVDLRHPDAPASDGADDHPARPRFDCPWSVPLLRHLLDRRGRLTTRTREQLRADLPAARAADADQTPALLSVGRIGPASAVGSAGDRAGPVRLVKALGLRRDLPGDPLHHAGDPAGLPPFTPRDAAVVHLVHGAVDWLYRPYLDGAAGGLAGVPDREREALHGLLAGESEKQLARRLGRSPHTVHSWVKNLYRRFGVTSRAELLALFLDRRA